MKYHFLIILLFFISCSPLAHKMKGGESNINSTRIVLTHLKETDSWKVEYIFDQPIKMAVFSRQVNQFREENWKVQNANVTIKKLDGKEMLVSDQPISHITLEHKSYYDETPKDYEFFIKFSNRDVLMYTGHYDLYPIHDLNELKEESYKGEEQNPTEFTLRPDKSESVVILGKIYKGSEIKWRSPDGDSTYIYFGNAKLVDDKNVMAVIDPSVPAWLQEETKRFIPKLFAYYTSTTGIPLSFKPVVFFNSNGIIGEGFSDSGGTLSGLIQLTIEGSGWAKKSKEGVTNIVRFLAHESAHLWNAQMHPYSDDKHAWMHEGGAEAFALRAMKDLRVISKNEYEKLYNEALNLCLLSLKNYPLSESGTKRQFDNYYNCGNAIALITENSIKDKNLFSFWKKLFAQSEKNKYYNADDYFNVLTEETSYQDVPKLLKELVFGPINDRSALFEKLLKNSNINFLKTNNPNVSNFKSFMAREYLQAFYREDCQGTLSLSRKKNSVVFNASEKCNKIKSNVELVKIDKYRIFEDAVTAHRFVSEHCRLNDNVSFYDIKNEELKLPCPKSIDPLPTFLEMKL